jgi:hypothetical protein
MIEDYIFVKSRSKEEFERLSPPPADLKNPAKFTLSDAEDVKKTERLLEVTDGLLSSNPQYLERVDCECGRRLTMYDFVFTGLVDAGHSKSFILHTMLGSRLVVNTPRRVRCSSCSRETKGFHSYACGGYSCSGKGG